MSDFILFVSDMHTGSELGLVHPEDDPFERGAKRKVRDYIFEHWRTCVETWVPSIVKGRSLVVVVNGDIMEGKHHGQRELLTTSETEQWVWARRLLGMVKAEKVFLVEGTECHTLDHEELMGEELGAVRTGGGRAAHSRLKMVHEGSGLCLSVRHHIGTTKRPWLQVNALGMDLAGERLASVNAGEQPTDIIVAAHRHTGAECVTDSGLAVTTASWQFPTRHVMKVVPDARAVVGACLLDFTVKRLRGLPMVWHYHSPVLKDEVFAI